MQISSKQVTPNPSPSNTFAPYRGVCIKIASPNALETRSRGSTHQQQEKISEKSVGRAVGSDDIMGMKKPKVGMNCLQTLQCLHCWCWIYVALPLSLSQSPSFSSNLLSQLLQLIPNSSDNSNSLHTTVQSTGADVRIRHSHLAEPKANYHIQLEC